MADYPITAVPRRVVYSGSAGTGPYSFSFPVIAQTDIAVFLNTTKLTLTTNYTVAITASNGTGVVTLGSAAAGSDFVTIVGARAVQRTTDFVTAGDLLASSLNVELDSQTIFVQQATEEADRAIKAPVTDPTSIDMTLPVKASRATKVLAFDSAGDPVVSTQTLAAMEAGSSAAASSATAAANSATAAASSAASAATSFDNFDDRYLGQKSSDPSTDNDGGSLITGALYFNTSNNVMMVYTGSAWVRTTPTSSDQTKINAVNANASNINTVAGVASNVTTVAGISAKVTSVAGIASDVTAVAGDATDIGAVAGKATEIGRLGTSDAVADMNTLGTSAIVTDMNLLATSANVTAMGLLGSSGNVSAMGLLGVSGVVTDMNLLGTSAVVADMALLGTSAVVADMAALSSTAVLADMALLGTTDAVSDMNTLGTADVVSDLNTVAGIAGDVTAVAAQVVGYDFSTTTTMADPGSGNVRFNNATLSSVSQIAIDDVDKNGVNQSAFIILWDDSTNTVKGTLVFRTAGGDVATFLITGLTDNVGWNQVAVTHVASSGTFSNGEDTFIGFTRAGDKGADGEGAGDVVGPSSATDNTVARYNSTTGKLIQGSGVTIDDSNNIGAASLTLTTDLAVAHGGTGASTLTDGGVLLGAGTGAVTAMAVLSNGQMIVGDGTGDPVAESGGTLRTSIGVDAAGTDNSTNVTLAGSLDYLTLSGQQITRGAIGLTTDVSGTLPIANGGTNATSAGAALTALGAAARGANSDITSITGLTTDLTVAQGGTGASSHTNNNVLIGAGTSAITSVAPSTSGNVLTSNGSAWTSAAAGGGPTFATAVNPSGVASVTFTGIPSGVNTVTVGVFDLDFSASETFEVQIGDSGGIETSGYLSSVGSQSESTNHTDAFVTQNSGMSAEARGLFHLFRVDGNKWVYSSGASGNSQNNGSGMKLLSGTLTQLRVKTGLGNNMSNGVIRISYQ